jgi:hypothetical protein
LDAAETVCRRSTIARRIADLERKIGQLTMENDFLKKPCSISGITTYQPSSMARMSA